MGKGSFESGAFRMASASNMSQLDSADVDDMLLQNRNARSSDPQDGEN
jgi:hypothetical protein